MQIAKSKPYRAVVAVCLCLGVLLSGCGTTQQDESADSDSGFVQMVNPLVPVNSLQEMEKYLGYTVPVLEKEVSDYIVLVIDGIAESGRIRYADGSDFNIKHGSGDISGIYGGILEAETTIDGISVSFFVYEDIRYAIWEKDGFTCSLTGTAELEKSVTALLK